MAKSNRVILSINDDMRKWLEDEAKRTGAPISEIIRRAIRAYSDQDMKPVKHGGNKPKAEADE